MKLQRDREPAGTPPLPRGRARLRAIRVGIADDHPITRSGAALPSSTSRTTSAWWPRRRSGREAIDLVRTQTLDVLLLDLDMPGQSGIDALTMIKAKAEHVGVLVLSGYPEHQYAVPLIRNGASGYLNKACEPAEIADGDPPRRAGQPLHHAGRGRTAGQPGDRADAGRLHEQLSARELQVFLKLAQGCTAGEVAAELSLSAKTVSTYRARLMRKLDARSNSDLTYYALKHRLLD